MSKKAIKSISIDPMFYKSIEDTAKKYRLSTSVVISEALKEVFLGEKSVILDTILKKG